MNCFDWEERIALYAGGDLGPAEAQAVERHVAECAGCQLLLSGLRESLSLVREAHVEGVDAAHFAAVRARVLSELERGLAHRWRFGWVYALAAAAIVMLVAMWPRPEQRMVVAMPPAPIAPVVARVPIPAGPLHLETRERTDAETVIVKLETDDPDVVIYWIAETKGETK
jgi:anti-sigma factor RsiW